MGPVPEKIFQALAEANQGYKLSYGTDDVT